MVKRTVTVLIGIVLSITKFSYAQRLNIKNYSLSDGLPQAQVPDLAQTEDGYIWLGTYGGGLAKFDGKKFVTYTKEDGLKDNIIEHVLADSDDNIWVSTAKGGVATFKGDSLVYPIKSDSLNKYDLTNMDELSEKKKWFGTNGGGVFIYDGQSISRLTTSDGLLSNRVWDFYEAEDGKVWMATDKGISVYNGDSFTNYTKEDGLNGRKTYRILNTPSGEKWIATNKGLSIWDGKSFKNTTTINGNSLGLVYDIMRASDGAIWIGTLMNGVYVYRDGKYQHITQDDGLSSNRISRMLEDHNNNIWIATLEDGVDIFKDQGFTFYDEHIGLTSNEVLSLYRDKNNTLWLGTKQGIESLNGEQVTSYSLPKEYMSQDIWNITGLPNGDKLIAMPDNSLMRFDGESFTNFSKAYGLENLFIYHLFIDSRNYLWIAADSGLYKVNLKNKKIWHFTSDDGLNDDTTYYIYEDSEGTKWIGTAWGLCIYDGEHFKSYTVKKGLGHNEVNYITEDQNGNIWMGTGGGVSVFKPGNDGNPVEIQNFGKSDGMVLVNTHFIWFDEQGYLWQGTNGGLQMLDVPNYEKTGDMLITHYPLANTGIGLEFNSHAISSSHPDEVWMGSMKGILRLKPKNLKRNGKQPFLHLTSIEIDGLPVKWEEYSDSLTYHNGKVNLPSATFPSGKHTYGFHFSGISFLNPENVKYRYKLEGFDKDWRPVTKENSAIYTNLSPGNYTLVLQANSGGGKFKNTKVTYDFAVAYPFWRTYWFYSLAILGIAAVIYGYIRIRVKYLEMNRLQELVDKQTRELQSALKEKEVLIKEIHHRVKNNLAVISGLLELQMGNTNNDFASRVLSESQRRVQSISMIHEKLYQNESLAEINFDKYVRELIEIIAYSFSNPEKNIDVNVSIDDLKLGVDQGIPCGLILNELVSNAYEHAFVNKDEGTITIQISKNGSNNITMVVADNGEGLDESFSPENTGSLGFTLVQTLCQQLETELQIKNHNPGTRFVIEFECEPAQPKVPA